MENQKPEPEQGMNIHLTKTEINQILEALIGYYKVRSFIYLPIYERAEAREAVQNYYEKQHLIDDLATKFDDFLEILDESENS